MEGVPAEFSARGDKVKYCTYGMQIRPMMQVDLLTLGITRFPNKKVRRCFVVNTAKYLIKSFCFSSAYICVICGPSKIFFIHRFLRWSQMEDYECFAVVLSPHLSMEISEEPYKKVLPDNEYLHSLR